MHEVVYAFRRSYSGPRWMMTHEKKSMPLLKDIVSKFSKDHSMGLVTIVLTMSRTETCLSVRRPRQIVRCDKVYACL